MSMMDKPNGFYPTSNSLRWGTPERLQYLIAPLKSALLRGVQKLPYMQIRAILPTPCRWIVCSRDAAELASAVSHTANQPRQQADLAR